jgi:P4 family phage/plasmid primase-like protien
MANHKSLREFLDAHKTDGNSTHTSMNGGNYFIGDDHLDQFYDLYVESILDGEKQFITEKSTNIGSSRVDFDFLYEKDVTKHLHTPEQVKAFTHAYLTAMKEFVVMPEIVEVYVMEKRKPTYSVKKKLMKSGIHLETPQLKTHKCIDQRVRRMLLNRMDEFFPDLPLLESWDKVYDEAVVNRSSPWTMYGSRKPDIIDPNALPYIISYILQWDGNDFTMIDGPYVPTISKDLLKYISIRSHDDQQTQMTDEGKKLYEAIQNGVGDSSRRPATRGRPLHRSEKPSSRQSSPNARMTQPLDTDKREYLRKHTMNLKQERASDYDSWVQVGICLHNIHPELLDVFLDFSSQNHEKYNEADCIQKWNTLTYRNDGEKLGEGTLRYWSKEDNFEMYTEIEKYNFDRLRKAACSLTEFDVASVIYAKFRDNYKCSDFKNNVWYRWAGHIWKETDSGVDLLLRLSKEVAQDFLRQMNIVSNELENTKLTECLTPIEKKDCKKCEYCILEVEREGFERVYKHLKKTAFKSNVMRECRELFFDESFNAKIDSNKDLIAFNNGVFDLKTLEFRDGKPDDYISFSTGIDYDSDKQYYEYPEWPKVEKFLQQVLPDPEVREYFVKHLATCMIGGNPAQKFHILTGSGSNGKSMITNLMTKVLGDYACTVPISLLTQKRKGSGNAAPEVARLKGRRFVTMQEPDEAITFNTGLMKELTSGEKMYARDLFKSGSEFEIQAKFHLACNDKPKINTTDGGTWRRLAVINFLSKFVQSPKEPNEFPLDESIQFAVNSVEWAVPFASYLIHVLKTSIGVRKLLAPAKVLEYTAEYRNENDAIAKFISEKIRKVEPNEQLEPVDKIRLRRAFKSWKDDNDQRALIAIDMEKQMEATFGKYPRGGWTNIKLEDTV